MTEDELETNFHDDIHAMADYQKKSYYEMHADLKREYNGYHFCKEMTRSVYNPYSLMNALSNKEISHYWYETGTPSFLVQLLKIYRPKIDKLSGSTIDRDSITMINSFKSNPLPILYQSGYLTINGYNARFDRYTMDYPNDEVKEGFLKGLLPLAVGERNSTEFDISSFVSLFATTGLL